MKHEFKDGMLTLRFGDEINPMVVSTPITGRPRKLRARWTPEEDQDLECFYDISMDDFIANFRKEYLGIWK